MMDYNTYTPYGYGMTDTQIEDEIARLGAAHDAICQAATWTEADVDEARDLAEEWAELRHVLAMRRE